MIIRDPESNIHLYLRQFPTGDPHPSAFKSYIHVAQRAVSPCWIYVMGGKLGLLLCADPEHNNCADEFLLYDWKSGVLLMV